MKQSLLLITSLSALPALGQIPLINSLSPARNAISAPRTTSVALGFTQSINPTTAAGIQVHSMQTGGRKAGTISVVNNTVTFAPTVSFLPGEKLWVSVPATVQATNGTSVAPQVFEFTAAVRGTGPSSFVAPAANADFDTESKGVGSMVVLGDVDGDGDLDVVSVSSQNRTVALRINNGLNSGNFVPPASAPSANLSSDVRGLAMGDLDGDGDLDLAVVNTTGTVSIRLNNGLRAVDFTPPATNAEVAVGSGSFWPLLGDVDGDGDLDLLVTNSGPNGTGNTVSVRLNSGLNSGSFVVPPTGAEIVVGAAPGAMVLGDIDGDGDLDLLVANPGPNGTGNTVSVRLNSGLNSGVFVAPAANAQITVGPAPRDLTLGDIDGDGDLDMLTANMGSGPGTGGGTVSIRLNSGLNSGNFVAPATGADSFIWGATLGVRLGDLDGDGDLDFVTTNLSQGFSSTVKIRLNSGLSSGTFIDPGGEPAILNAGYDLELGDVDGDGDLDMITCHEAGRMSLRLNQSATPLGVTQPFATARLEVLPNPASGTAYVKVPARTAAVQVLDALGRVVRVVAVEANGGQTALPLSGLMPGIYIVQAGEATARLLVAE